MGWVFFLAKYLEMHRNTHSEIEHGSAEWDSFENANARMADLEHPENNRILSKHVSQALDGPKSFPNNNMIVVGAPGTGKSLFVIAPNILKCISSYLFMDPKGELVEKYGNYMRKNGYQIRVLNLKNMEQSDRYNPFVYIRSEDDIPRLIMNILNRSNHQMPKKEIRSGTMAAHYIYSPYFTLYGDYPLKIKNYFFTMLTSIGNLSMKPKP